MAIQFNSIKFTPILYFTLYKAFTQVMYKKKKTKWIPDKDREDSSDENRNFENFAHKFISSQSLVSLAKGANKRLCFENANAKLYPELQIPT